MHPFASYVLRSYFKATGWNEDNMYSNLTRSSTALLDFAVPRGLNFSIAKSPNSLFKTTYSMTALPTLNGSVGYIFTSCDLNIQGSAIIPFKELVDRFKVYERPRRPEGKEEVWLAGERIDMRDYLLYGRLYIPAGRLDAVYSTRISPTWQAVIAAISEPRRQQQPYLSSSRPAVEQGAGLSSIMFNLQHDIGKWCTEYSWNGDDGMFGVRMLHNFGKHGQVHYPNVETVAGKPKRVDEEEAMEGGLKGRISAGAEVYFSMREKSGGVSTGVRFTTIPDATPSSFQLPVQTEESEPSIKPLVETAHGGPPTTVTAVFNPMMGHITTAYASRVSRDLTMATRFDFNVYSYESEWAMGFEWWLRRGIPRLGRVRSTTLPDDCDGVVKARMSTTTDLALMWEGRVKNLLVSLGINSDLTSASRPIRSIGLEISYFSSDDQTTIQP